MRKIKTHFCLKNIHKGLLRYFKLFNPSYFLKKLEIRQSTHLLSYVAFILETFFSVLSVKGTSGLGLGRITPFPLVCWEPTVNPL